MKRSLALLLASLLVVFGLTACGNDKKQDQGNQDSAVVGDDTVGNNGSTANDGLTGNNATDNGDKNNTNKDDSLLDDAEQGVTDAVQDAENALNDVTGNAQNNKVRARNRSGDLRDMENGVARNSTL